MGEGKTKRLVMGSGKSKNFEGLVRRLKFYRKFTILFLTVQKITDTHGEFGFIERLIQVRDRVEILGKITSFFFLRLGSCHQSIHRAPRI